MGIPAGLRDKNKVLITGCREELTGGVGRITEAWDRFVGHITGARDRYVGCITDARDRLVGRITEA